tara:strand:- start:233 stop:361 length:129 start_codon:yes stop_codon:yes gene_type:complete
MDTVTYFVDELDGTEYAIVNHGNGNLTSMLKSTYEAMQVDGN